MGGWRFGNTIDGCQAEYVLVPDAMANLAPIADELTDEQVLMCPDIMSTGFRRRRERARSASATRVAVFAQGPIGLCATAGAQADGRDHHHRRGPGPERLAMARRLGADHVVDFSKADPVEEIMRLTDGRGVDVAIEALGTQQTFEACLRVLRPGGTLSSLGVYSTDLHIPLDAFAAGLGDHQHRHHALPGRQGAHAAADGGDRLRPRRPPAAGHAPLLARQIEEAYELFGHQRDGVLKVAIVP